MPTWDLPSLRTVDGNAKAIACLEAIAGNGSGQGDSKLSVGVVGADNDFEGKGCQSIHTIINPSRNAHPEIAMRSVMILGVLLFSPGLAVAQAAQPKTDLLWTDLRTLPVEGKGWTETKAFYDRLPGKAEGVVRDAVWNLSRQSAGISARFVTDAPEIR